MASAAADPLARSGGPVREALAATLARLVRDVPDFPEPGVVFKDVAPLLADPEAFAAVAGALADRARDTGASLVAGIEARGFVLGAPAALAAGLGFVPLRKVGKLPGPTRSVAYGLEYGDAVLQIQADGVPRGARVLVVDDVLATGGTAAAAAALIRAAGGEPTELAVLLEIAFLGGRARVAPLPVSAVLSA